VRGREKMKREHGMTDGTMTSSSGSLVSSGGPFQTVTKEPFSNYKA